MCVRPVRGHEFYFEFWRWMLECVRAFVCTCFVYARDWISIWFASNLQWMVVGVYVFGGAFILGVVFGRVFYDLNLGVGEWFRYSRCWCAMQSPFVGNSSYWFVAVWFRVVGVRDACSFSCRDCISIRVPRLHFCWRARFLVHTRHQLVCCGNGQ